jgi:hypothetical protein
VPPPACNTAPFFGPYPFNLKRSAFYLLFCRYFVFHLAVSIYAQAH